MTRFALAVLEGFATGVTMVVFILAVDWVRERRARAKAHRG